MGECTWPRASKSCKAQVLKHVQRSWRAEQGLAVSFVDTVKTLSGSSAASRVSLSWEWARRAAQHVWALRTKNVRAYVASCRRAGLYLLEPA